jgi:Glycosyltransferases involved in cell wall biogenesis
MSVTFVCIVKDETVSYFHLMQRCLIYNIKNFAKALLFFPLSLKNKVFPVNSYFKIIPFTDPDEINDIEVSKYIETDYYFVITPEFFAFRGLKYDDLFEEGRSLTSNIEDSFKIRSYYTNIAKELTENNIEDYHTYLISRGLFEKYHKFKSLVHKQSVKNFSEAYTFDHEKLNHDSKPFIYFNVQTIVPPSIVEDCIDKFYWAKKQKPLISCLMVTRNRINHVKRSIKHFYKQTYPNLELIVIDNGKDETTDYCNSLNDERIKVFKIENASSYMLGDFRNMSLEKASGEFVICWDDDDIYHPSRVSCMFKRLLNTGADAILLSSVLLAWPKKNYYAVSFDRKIGWEGTMLLRKEKAVKYKSLQISEDTCFVRDLMASGVVVKVIEDPGFFILYTYLVHGSNSWTLSHFRGMFSSSTSLKRKLRTIEDANEVEVAIKSLSTENAERESNEEERKEELETQQMSEIEIVILFLAFVFIVFFMACMFYYLNNISKMRIG